METAISIRNLFKSFDGGVEFVLKGLNLEVPKGKLTMMIGYSGTGKSVLLKHILGIHKPTSGEINVLGKNLWDMNYEELIAFRCKLGVLFQHAALFDDLSVIENVCFPIREHRPKMGEQETIDLAIYKLKISGLDETHFNKLPEALSGGMKKRVGLARALALDPEIIIYDEPTTGLDPILTEMVDDLIRDTHDHHEGATSLVVSHDLNAAFRIGDNIVMLDQGKVLMSGTPEDFLNSDIDLVKRFVSKGLRKELQ